MVTELESSRDVDMLFRITARLGTTSQPGVFGPFQSFEAAERCLVVVAAKESVESAVIEPLSETRGGTAIFMEKWLDTIRRGVIDKDDHRPPKPTPPANVETRDGSPTPRKMDA